MSQVVKQVTLVLGVVTFVGVILYFILSNFYQDNQRFVLSDTVENAVIKNRDDSARINQGVFYLNTEAFEAEITSIVNEHPAFKNKVIQVDFDYLEDKYNTGIKGIKVVVLTEREQQQATYWINTPNN